MTDLEPDAVTTAMSPIVESMATRVDILRVVAEAATSYRRHLESLGWDPMVVTGMSAQVLNVWTLEVLK